jgi:hypothetical protein
VTEGKDAAIPAGDVHTFNHAQLFGPAAVNGDSGTGTFGQLSRSAAACASRPQILFDQGRESTWLPAAGLAVRESDTPPRTDNAMRGLASCDVKNQVVYPESCRNPRHCC